MPYHLSDHIYITQFRDELILLDTKRDKYTICYKQISELLIKLFGGHNSSFFDLHLSQQDCTIIHNLIEDGIIEKKDALYSFYIDQKQRSEGVSNIDWRLPLENNKVGLNFTVLKALITLLKVNFYIKFKGFYSTIQLIKKSHQSCSTYIIPSDEDLRSLANIVNNACFIYPTRTKCLEWAMTFVLLALKRKWKCNLEIGVQNYPFMAHAWVECDENVVMDSHNLREDLAIILNEPFRRIQL